MRVARCTDADWLLSEDAFRIYASCMYHPTYGKYRAQMEGWLSDPSVKVYVCENDSMKTGMTVLRIADGAAEIVGIAVSGDSRRKGIGKRLIRSVMDSEDLESLKAQTDEDSIGFYRKCGFTEEKTVVEYPDGPAVRYDCVLFKQTDPGLPKRSGRARE